MPRNAANKSNKSAQRLPVLIKLTSKNINNKRKRRNRSSISNNKRKNNYITIRETENRKKLNYIKSIATATSFNKSEIYCDANDNVSILTTSTISDKKITKITKYINKAPKEIRIKTEEPEQAENILTFFPKSIESVKSIKRNEPQTKEEKHLIIKNNLINNNTCIYNSNIRQNTTKASEEVTNLISTSLSETERKSSEATLFQLRPNSPNSSISSLYPIVIETAQSFQQDSEDKKQQHKVESDTATKKKKLHSISIWNSSNNSNNNTNNNNRCTCCPTAVDTLEQQTLQNNNNNSCNNNNASTSTLSKCYNNSNKPKKQSTQSSAAIATKVATSSKIASTFSSNQSQEVKARLATLRIRKKVSQQQEQRGSVKAAPNIPKKTCPAASTAKSTTEKHIQTSESKDTSTGSSLIEKHFLKKVAPVLDNATLDLIETLSDDVKKPNSKRKRSTATAVLLGLTTLHQPRSKRIAPNPVSQVDKAAAAIIAIAPVINSGIDKGDKKPTGVNFLKPFPIDVTNTNLKKRARIMSLYERPFQTANDGRGGVVSNGYMTSSRSSASSGGAAGSLVINDTCDTQEMANQYYLSGGSGSGIAGNSNQSLVGNGTTINHAPTMGTLCNIGNTCYLNSVVYTLRFAPQFLHNLHHLLADLSALQQNIARARAKSSSLGRGISTVHMENVRSWSNKDLPSLEQYTSGTPINSVATTTSSTALAQVTQKSSHQLLTEKLHELYQSLYRNEINESAEPHHADTLLHAIQDVSNIFEGNQQQDAHEFLMCVLNSIRETSQTLIKAIAECPDVILNGYISNPDEMERDLIKNHSTVGSGGMGIVANNSISSNNLATASSKPSSFFSRKSKRKDKSKNSKNSRLQSPLKDALLSGNSQTTTAANSLFYLNSNDLNLTANSPASAIAVTEVATSNSGMINSPLNSSSFQMAGAGDETDTSSSLALILKDKQRLKGKIKELGLDFFNEDFEGITVSTTKCLSCETITEQKETMIDIAVPVPQAGYESNEFMDRPSSFIQNSCITREYFRNENKYRCEQCCGYTEAIRSISYEVLPRLLIIQLSRFSGGMEKINSYIPTSFTLQCFCSKCCKLSDANKLHIYKLYSVITHVGATMSVGHYIAYTCSLEWANEYINCPKEQRRRASQERNLGVAGNGGNVGPSSTNNAQSTTASTGLSASGTGFMKMKMKFFFSSGDMSKNVKQLNGLSSSSKGITNGIGKLTMNSSGGGGCSASPQCPVTCQSINCCAMRLTAQQQLQYQSASSSDFSEESSQYFNGSGFSNASNYNNNIHHNFATSGNTSGYGSTGRGSTKISYATTQNNCSEPIWYMCDDDKIKAMTQREFEELLSPARKITITPYLLFYARYNLQSTPPKSTTASTSSPGPVTSSPQTSWSNESLQSSTHSAHSSGLRM